jgi:hypothetical protein
MHDMQDLKLLWQVHVIQSSWAVSFVKMEWISKIMETVTDCIIRGDVVECQHYRLYL